MMHLSNCRLVSLSLPFHGIYYKRDLEFMVLLLTANSIRCHTGCTEYLEHWQGTVTIKHTATKRTAFIAFTMTGSSMGMCIVWHGSNQEKDKQQLRTLWSKLAALLPLAAITCRLCLHHLCTHQCSLPPVANASEHPALRTARR